MSERTPLIERTVPGLHDFLMEKVVGNYLSPGCRVVDLGAGSGALAVRLEALGAEVTACDQIVPEDPPIRFMQLDLDRPSGRDGLPTGIWDCVTAVEVIEHLESPTGFLRQIAALLSPTGVAVITTPNLDSLSSRWRFALRAKLRMFDEWGDSTHVSPIFRDLMQRHYLPRAGLRIVEEITYPATGFVAGRKLYRDLLRPAAGWLGKRGLGGDSRIWVVAHGCEPDQS